MIPAINGVMLAIGGSLAASIVAKVTVITALGSPPLGSLAGAARRFGMRSSLRRSV